MKRWSTLYIANFLLPIFFFLCLDLASFLISDTGGEKLGFKITVLLAVTVMQLLLNEILPGSSEKIPLIVIFCIGIFSLMLLSVLETILVMNLIDRDNSSQEKETDDKRGTKRLCLCASIHDKLADETPFEVKKLCRDRLTEDFVTLKMVLDELEHIRSTQNLLSDRKEGYWTKMAKRIDKIFTMFYFLAVIVFLVTMLSLWNSDD
ncbi:5-hydroxytryptamine receptor 3A-like [Kryptolebias marmoratus]|uniref:5-hydroxytryptamine receptor 3A-like n=1 Tax=Kryptolebias marmoratus TaxID=37003 RepID=UPI0018ACEF58|nr:5-hydroxytryptamine receptor 3A-like [Kryptolebias marmoratus]